MEGHVLVVPSFTARNLQLACTVFVVLLFHFMILERKLQKS